MVGEGLAEKTIFEQRLKEVRKQDMGLLGRLVLKAKRPLEPKSQAGESLVCSGAAKGQTSVAGVKAARNQRGMGPDHASLGG